MLITCVRRSWFACLKSWVSSLVFKQLWLEAMALSKKNRPLHSRATENSSPRQDFSSRLSPVWESTDFTLQPGSKLFLQASVSLEIRFISIYKHVLSHSSYPFVLPPSHTHSGNSQSLVVLNTATSSSKLLKDSLSLSNLDEKLHDSYFRINAIKKRNWRLKQEIILDLMWESDWSLWSAVLTLPKYHAWAAKISHCSCWGRSPSHTLIVLYPKMLLVSSAESIWPFSLFINTAHKMPFCSLIYGRILENLCWWFTYTMEDRHNSFIEDYNYLE